MASERIKRRIEQYLDAADEAAGHFDWPTVRENAEAALRLDPTNTDAQTYLDAAERDTAPTAAAFGGGRNTLLCFRYTGRQEHKPPRRLLREKNIISGLTRPAVLAYPLQLCPWNSA